jgi:hypothetical protein
MQFSETVIEAVWEKAREIPGRYPADWRQDECGAWLHRHKYNNSDSEYGWKIDKIVAGGADEVDNLQAFHLSNGVDIADGQRRCRVSADRTGLVAGQRVHLPRNSSV